MEPVSQHTQWQLLHGPALPGRRLLTERRAFSALCTPYEVLDFSYPGGSRKRSRAADSSFSRAASEAPSDTGSMEWAGSLQTGEEEEILPNGKEPTPAPLPSLDEHIPSVEVGC